MLRKELVNQVQAIVLPLCICGMCKALTLKMTLEVITDVIPRGVPQLPGVFRSALPQDGHKEVAQLLFHLHVLCLIQALVPLPVIIQEAMCYAGLSERTMVHIIKSVEVLKGGGTPDTGEKKAQVEALSTGGVGMVHPPNSKSAPLPGGPLATIFLMPNHLIGKVLVEKVTMLCTLSIGPEPSSKCGILVCLSIHHILNTASCGRVKNNCMLIRKVNLKPNNGWAYAPASQTDTSSSELHSC
jgi:hypothetical protein